MFCHQCQASNPDSALFCRNCGTKQHSTRETLPEANTTKEEQIAHPEEKEAPEEPTETSELKEASEAPTEASEEIKSSETEAPIDASEEIKVSETEASADTSSNDTNENTIYTSSSAVAVLAESTEQKKNYRPEDVVTPDKLRLTPGLASLLSVLIVGLGQMLNGQLYKGLLMIIIHLALGIITCGITVIPGWIVSGIDAYGCAKALQEGKTIGKWSFFGKSID